MVARTRTKAERQEERRRIARTRGKAYRTADERRAAKLARAAALSERQALKRPRQTPEERREADRLRSARYYSANKARVHAVKAAYKRKRRATDAKYRAMDRAGLKRWKQNNPDKAKALRRRRLAKLRSENDPSFRAARRRQRLSRRARLRNAFVEHVDPREVFRRSNGVCGICARPVCEDENWTVDHVVPLAAEGEHSYANTQLAHFLCNSKKGAALPGGGTTTPTWHGSFRGRHQPAGGDGASQVQLQTCYSGPLP